MTKNPGYFIAVISAVILSTTGIFIAYLSKEFALPALVLSFWREFLVFILLLIFLGIRSPRSIQLTRRKIAFFIPYGLILAVFNALWTLSVALNGAGLATFLVYTSPIFTALLGRVFLKECLTGTQWFCIALSMTGCLFLSGFLNGASVSIRVAGFAVGLLSGLAFALYSIQGRKAGIDSEAADTWSTLCWVFGFASIFMLLFNALFSGRSVSGMVLAGHLFFLGASAKGWIVLLLLAGLPTLTGYGFYNMSLRFLPPLTVSLIASSEPVFTAILAYLILREGMTFSSIFGGILILLSVVVIQTGIPGLRRAEVNR